MLIHKQTLQTVDIARHALGCSCGICCVYISADRDYKTLLF